MFSKPKTITPDLSIVPPISARVRYSEKNVTSGLWPKIATTLTVSSKLLTPARTYRINSINNLNQFYSFIKILSTNRAYPAGIHLELTGKDVIECLSDKKNIHDNMRSLYESSCDPRLSASQCLELAFSISDIYAKL